jgi:hypothetical protein
VSVHGEYSRSVEAMLDRIRALDHPVRDSWVAALESARVGSQPDLSAAALAARVVLASIADDPEARCVEGLIDPRARLEAHCRAILGE